MDFTLDEDQRAYRDLAQTFAAAEIAPRAEEYDESEEFPWPIVKKAFDAGLMYINVPERWGGAGLSLLDECLVTEELAWGCSGIALAMTIGNIAALGLTLGGDEDQCANVLGEVPRANTVG